MTVIASPSRPLPHSDTNGDYAAGPSNIQYAQFAARPSRPPAEQPPSAYNFASVRNGQDNGLGNPSLANGHAAGDIAATGVNPGLSPEQQDLIRSNTGSHTLPQRPRAKLSRTQTDFGPNHQARSAKTGVPEEVGELRHGWEDQYNSSEFLGLLSSVSPAVSLILFQAHRLSTFVPLDSH